MNSDLMTSGMADMARTRVYNDFNAMHDMRRAARDNPDAALEEVARQFESIFIKMMLKQMRQASFGDPIFNSHSGDMYRDMFDDQLALHMGQQQGMGLADMLVRQLRQQRGDAVQAPLAPRAQGHIPAAPAEQRQPLAGFDSPGSFVSRLWPHAEKAAGELGTEPRVILAQAALETGWGRHVIEDKAGRSSHNLFNIKADSRWPGRSVQVDTLEFDGPVASRQKAAFRAYDSYAQSFHDYVDFLKSNPRYQDALANAADPESFARKLHEAGYATDPKYADKVIDIMNRNIVMRPDEYDLQGSAEMGVG